MLSELENEERHMVDKLNMTRMSALSCQSANRNNRSINMSSAKKQGGSSPFKDVRPRDQLQSASVKKPGPRNLLDDENDLNERIEFDQSLKIIQSPQKNQVS